MKKVIVSATAIALLAGVLALSGNAWSQQGSERAASPNVPHKVGLIDMAFVFKNYKKFETLREELKLEIAGSEEKAKAVQQETQQLQGQLKQLNEGSPEHGKLEKQLVQKMAEFETFRREKSREFLKKESQIYSQVYHEVEDVVKLYATQFGYTLVIRFNREDNENDTPQAIMQNMNRQVVYYREDDDITQKILNKLNKNAGGAPATTAPSTERKPAPRTTGSPKNNN